MGLNWKTIAGMGGIVVAVIVVMSLNRKPFIDQSQPHMPNGDAPPFESPVVNGMRTYKSGVLHFELSYPEELSVKEYGAGNTSTIVFEDPTGQHGFQVFVVPYSSTTVSQERFKMDEPSGVMKEPTQVVIDSTTATAFFSTNSLFGDTREVWFIHDGLLYEVTTYKDLDSWLAGIMSSWKFI